MNIFLQAVNAAPSKDTLWTTDNGKFEVPGCAWTPDHEEPAAELHVVIALMTTGPVGISDLVGKTNAFLAKKTIAQDGTLLKPSKPLTSVDSALAAAMGDRVLTQAPHAGPPGHVYSTYTGASIDAVTAWYFVSFKMTDTYGLVGSDFYPTQPAGTKFVYRAFDNGAGCTNGRPANACVTPGGSTGPVFTAPKSDMTNVTGGTDYKPVVTTVWPLCSSGAVFLGELSKYVAVSPQRFSDVACTGTGVTSKVHGTPGEGVVVYSITGGQVVVQTVQVPSAGYVVFSTAA